MTRVLVEPEDAGRNCPYCLFQLVAGTPVERCDACGALHHERCWSHLNGCAVRECSNSGRLARPSRPPAPRPAAPSRPARARRRRLPSPALTGVAVVLGAVAVGALGLFLALGRGSGTTAAGHGTHSTRRTTTTAPVAGVPGVYVGPFTSGDRLQRCRATERTAVCTSGPAGAGVRLDAGGGVSRLSRVGVPGEAGPRLSVGTSFRTPSGSIECDSTARAITCTDLSGSKASFTIGARGIATTG